MLTLYILYVYFGYLGKPIELIFLRKNCILFITKSWQKKDNEKGIFCQISEEFLKYFPTHFFISYQPTDAEFQVMQTKIVQKVVSN